jgi:hypothetical protein
MDDQDARARAEATALKALQAQLDRQERLLLVFGAMSNGTSLAAAAIEVGLDYELVAGLRATGYDPEGVDRLEELIDAAEEAAAAEDSDTPAD